MLKASLPALHLPMSRTEAITRVLQIVTYPAVEKRMEHKGEQRQSLVEPQCKALELLQLVKRHISG